MSVYATPLMGELDETANDEAIAALLQAQWENEEGGVPEKMEGGWKLERGPLGGLSFTLSYSTLGVQPGSLTSLDPLLSADGGGSSNLETADMVNTINNLYEDQLYAFVLPDDDFEDGDVVEVAEIDSEGVTLLVGPCVERKVYFHEPCESESQVLDAFLAILDDAKQERKLYSSKKRGKPSPGSSKHNPAPTTVRAAPRTGKSPHKSPRASDVSGSPMVKVAAFPVTVTVSVSEGGGGGGVSPLDSSLYATIVLNSCQTSRKLLTVTPRPSSLDVFIHYANLKFNRKGKKGFTRVFAASGTEVTSVDDLVNHGTYFMSLGEDYAGHARR